MGLAGGRPWPPTSLYRASINVGSRLRSGRSRPGCSVGSRTIACWSWTCGFPGA